MTSTRPLWDLSSPPTLVGWLVLTAIVHGIDSAFPLSAEACAGHTLFILMLSVVAFWLDAPRRILFRAGGFALLLLLAAAKWYVLVESGFGDEPALAGSYRIFTVAALLMSIVVLLMRGSGVQHALVQLAKRPARLTMFAFVSVALLGALILNLPPALADASEASFIDGLFHAMSAVCVTGLTVSDVATTYTRFGQAVLLALFQLGGIGIMALSSALLLIGGDRIQFRSKAVLAKAVDAPSLAKLKRSVLSILAFTILFEAVGTAILYAVLRARPDVGSPLWAAVFHSVSAFCNAGFTLFAEGLRPFVDAPAVCLPIFVLIVIGGLGFPVLDELVRSLWSRLRGDRPNRMTLHTRVVLTTTGALLVFGAVTFGLLEWDHDPSLGHGHRIVAALFQSATARTAGFSTVDIRTLGAPALMLLSILMFIGASPGSTGGGIKTTTLATLFAAFRGELRPSKTPELFGRCVSPRSVRRALGVFFMSAAIVSALTFLLLITERGDAHHIAFEAVSAFGTVGLTTGITEDLSIAGKLLVTATMLVGRIGPLTFALVLANNGPKPNHSLPEEEVHIG